MTALERFVALMEGRPVDRVPNWELGVWGQTVDRWQADGLDLSTVGWDWFRGDCGLGFDRKEFVWYSSHLLPAFEYQVLEADDETELIRDSEGRVRRALKTGSVRGTRASMDQYLRFPVQTPADWADLKRRYDPREPRRLEADWQRHVPRWRTRDVPLVFGPNCSTLGFYWIAREWLGTEGLSYAWYDEPAMLHDMLEHWADFLIESARPVLEQTTVEYICFNEDLAMKSGPLLSPATYREFIFPRMKRVVEFLKGHGVRWICVDSDGNPEAIVPLLLDAGVDILWPLERAADQDPARLRAKFGPSLHLWGGVDKRELAKGRAAIDAHLASLAPVVEAGGFVPHVDHTVPPDVSWDDFRYYLEVKERLLRGAL